MEMRQYFNAIKRRKTSLKLNKILLLIGAQPEDKLWTKGKTVSLQSSMSERNNEQLTKCHLNSND